MSTIPQPRGNRIVEYRKRDFSRFGIENNINCVPVDGPEEDRADEHHRILQHIFGGRAVYPSLSISSPEVLECGFGTGTWISDVLNEYPDCEVTGVDIFDHDEEEDDSEDEDEDDDGDDDQAQEYVKRMWNLNAPFRLAPVEDRLSPETFDLINSRFLVDGINESRWPSLIAEYKALLRPSGWLQLVEIDWTFQSDNGTRLPKLEAWWEHYSRALRRMQKKPTVARQLHYMLRSAGFEETKEQVYNVPIGDWPPVVNPGNRILSLVSEMLCSFAIVPFLRVLRMPDSQFIQVVKDAQQELLTPNAKIYNRVHVVYGQKPGATRR